MKRVSEPDWDESTYIVRSIFLEDFLDFEKDEIGCHWSTDHGYIHNNGNCKGSTQTKSELFQIFARKDNLRINEEATEISNENYPNECEIVLECNQAITILYYNSEEDTYYEISGNTGDRVDAWVRNCF